MHFSVFSLASTAARIAVLVLPILLLSCVTADVAARQIDVLPTAAAGVSGGQNPSAVAGYDDDAATGVSYEVTDSPESATVVPGVDEFDFGDDGTDATGSPWIQKVPRTRPSAESPKSPDGPGSALKSPGNPLSLSHVLSNVLYGPAWPATDASPRCSEDMRVYNAHAKNFTLWATKSN